MNRYSYRSDESLSGAKTYVKPESGTDTTKPEKSREDYADGKPQRDRVLPLPSGHPEGRDEKRPGPPVFNTPSDSKDNSSNYSKPRSENAVSPKPMGKPLHQSPRTTGVPGDQYGHPYIDQGTMLNQRRTMTAYLLSDEEEMEKEAKIEWRPPRRKDRQHKQRGQARRDAKRYYQKNRFKIKRNVRQYQRKNKVRLKMYYKQRRKHPEKYQRLKTRRACMQANKLQMLLMLLAGLRSAHLSHWTTHWQVKGMPYYGDHLLMDKLYNSLPEEIDTLAEKIVAEFGGEAVDLNAQMAEMSMQVKAISEASTDPLHRALCVEEFLQDLFEVVYDELEGQMSLGMDDFIMATANDHETNLYLLKQRFR
jgi:DNA-binding ferritin-like protein